MKLYQGTGCHIVLIGVLASHILLTMNEQGDFRASIEVKIKTEEQRERCFDVIVLDDAALKIKQYGFPGLYLLIEGCVDDVKIIAEKITFLDYFEPDASSIKKAHFSIRQTLDRIH